MRKVHRDIRLYIAWFTPLVTVHGLQGRKEYAILGPGHHRGDGQERDDVRHCDWETDCMDYSFRATKERNSAETSLLSVSDNAMCDNV